MTWRSRLGFWSVVGVAAASIVILSEAGSLLSSIESEGARNFGPEVFSGLHLNPFDTRDFLSAVEVWRTDQTTALTLLKWHLRVDFFFFIPALGILFGYSLRQASGKPMFAWTYAAIFVVIDWIETALAYFVLVRTKLATPQVGEAAAVQVVSLVKWLIIIFGLIALLVYLANPNVGKAKTSISVKHARQAIAGDSQTPGIALKSLTALVAIFAVAIVLPIGGPLNQLADVLRAVIDGGWSAVREAAVPLVLLASYVAVAGWLSTTSQENVPVPVQSIELVPIVLFWTLPLIAVSFVLDGRLTYPPFAFVLVFVIVVIAAGIARVGRRDDLQSLAADPWSTGTIEKARWWVGALSGSIIVVGSLGLVRATLPVLILGLDGPGWTIWDWLFSLGVFFALIGGFIVQWLVVCVRKRLTKVPTRVKWLGVSLVAVSIISFVVWLGLTPNEATLIGTNGVLAVAVGAIAVLLGSLTWLTRHGPRWDAPRYLGVSRTPWTVILVTVWLVAGLINSGGGYHDARVDEEIDTTLRYPTLAKAFHTWHRHQDLSDCAPRDAIPMVFVSAPGGGIRAAYWTSRSLERLFGLDDCARNAIFAISGVSGGSVGSTVWLAATSAGESVTTAIESITSDKGLSAAAAALFFRDSLQPFLGTTRGSDRAAIMEESWAESLPSLFGEGQSGYSWATLGDGDGTWVPVMVLNGSSVNDGCRVLITNTGQLAHSSSVDCRSFDRTGAGTDNRGPGPLSSSFDALNLLPNESRGTCGNVAGGMRTTTAAYLSARFPVISPSGAIFRCELESSADSNQPHATYVVDGGYVENSLLTLIQLLEGLKPAMAKKNETNTIQVEPWIVVVDNHYRSSAVVPPPGRPRELIAPLVAKLNAGQTLSQPSLEQMAIEAVSQFHNGDAPSCAGFVRIAPSKGPTPEAPLGWVLSETSRDSLDSQMDQIFRHHLVSPFKVALENLSLSTPGCT